MRFAVAPSPLTMASPHWSLAVFATRKPITRNADKTPKPITQSLFAAAQRTPPKKAGHDQPCLTASTAPEGCLKILNCFMGSLMKAQGNDVRLDLYSLNLSGSQLRGPGGAALKKETRHDHRY